MNRIQSRSPYIVTHTNTGLTSIKVELYMYTGIKTTDRPTLPNITLQVEALNEVCNFDISEFADDFLDIEFNGSYDSQMIWLDYTIQEWINGFEQIPYTTTQKDFYGGFRYYFEGAQNESTANYSGVFLMSNKTIYKPSYAYPKLAIIASGSTTVKYYQTIDDVSTEVGEQIIAASTDSASRIVYLTIPNANVDRITGGGFTINVKNLPCSKHTEHKLTFINRYGALQDLYLTGKSLESMKVNTVDKYKRNTLVNDTFDISKHRNTFLNKNGVNSMVLSSAFVDESQNMAFGELLLSRKVWLDTSLETLPVTITDSNIKYKTSLNDKLISYTINLDFAYDTINNIR